MAEEKKECDGLEFNVGKVTSISECASSCEKKASMFIFGTNDFGFSPARCDDGGSCECSCETSAAAAGECNMISHNGYRLYKFTGAWDYPLATPLSRGKPRILGK